MSFYFVETEPREFHVSGSIILFELRGNIMCYASSVIIFSKMYVLGIRLGKFFAGNADLVYQESTLVNTRRVVTIVTSGFTIMVDFTLM